MDPELLPYLEEADDASENKQLPLTDVSGEREQRKALENLVEASLLAGPLPEIVQEVRAEDEEETHRRLLEDAAQEAALDKEISQIYASIIARAPEHKVQPSLDRVRMAMNYLADPQNAFPAVHITGTNGKTSTARMIDSLAQATGLRTGRFTSPHLHTVRERISLDGQPISKQSFISAYQDVAQIIELVDQKNRETGGPRMSFFEVFTVMAYAAFADYPIDLGVIEVGMGGRWDATNVIDAKVGVITPISKDHEKWLGSTVGQIASEKAGIIKDSMVLILAKQPEEARKIILEEAAHKGATVREYGTDIEVLSRQQAVGGQLITVRTPAAVYEDVYVPLFGAHQSENAALAIAAFEALSGGTALEPRLLENGMANATSPGRAEILRSSPTIMVDAAHNPGGAAVLRTTLEDDFPFTDIVGVYSAMADKDVEGVLSEMEPLLASLVLTQMPGERAMELEELVRISTEVFGPDRVFTAEDTASAIDKAVTAAEEGGAPAPNTAVVAFGSVVFAAHVREVLGAGRPPAENMPSKM
ncbi:tetrahydrofolate synthase [Actinomyces sp. HMSC06A08]|nr:tetrahydrofolate synthase [Actinomyces sp. HMSC064C12]OFK05060.1 tetrahydrofolate synthase [Actinomyces sp. HMSC072A03]OFT55368.1 tetrahydrofolate synthase [Actinomyces sp. HMSC06A08]